MRRRRIARLVAVVAALSAFALTACQETTTEDAQSFVNLINNERYQRGIPLVPQDADLSAEADRWAQQMRNDCWLRHRSDLSQGLPAGWTMVAENVGYASDIWGVHNAFMGSASHRDNILNPNFTRVGIGAVWGNCWGWQQLWVVQIFVRV